MGFEILDDIADTVVVPAKDGHFDKNLS